MFILYAKAVNGTTFYQLFMCSSQNKTPELS